jgi:adenylate kinase
MIISITGTPGTGKTSVSKKLEKKGYKIVDLNTLCKEKKFFEGFDKKRDSQIINIEKLDDYISKIKPENEIWILDSHISHLLKSVDKVFLLRCHPNKLKNRLKDKNWMKEKVEENLEAEIIDIILCETLDNHDKKNVFEIDTTKKDTSEVSEIIVDKIKNNFKTDSLYEPGHIDWSEELLKRKK